MAWPRCRLVLTVLEDRTVPSAFVLGDPWPDPDSLTISFTPDTTKLGTGTSALFKTLNKAGKTADWQLEILRAFQTWAVESNLNIGLVSDSGDPFGTPGEIQGDYRFGDVRIGARLLSMDALANAVPFEWAAGTWSGDVLFNTAVNFGINTTKANTYDLFTTALHEAGHVFGLPHSDDPLSVMSERYVGIRTGLAASDIAAIRAVHGFRQPDRYDADASNDTWDTATVLSGTGNLSISADITTTADADYYRFLTPANATKFAVRLQTSGLSLLTAKVTVYNAAGQVVKADFTTDPRDGDLEVKLDKLTGGSWYTIKVEANRNDVFGVGRYQLSIVYKDAPVQKSNFQKDGGSNDTPDRAGGLNRKDGNWKREQNGGWFSGVIENRDDVDYYRLTAPRDADGLQALLIQIRSLSAKGVTPAIDVFDAQMNPLPIQVIGTSGNHVSIQATGMTRGQDYFIRVRGDGTKDATGNYRLTADFTTPKQAARNELQVGALSPASRTATGTITLGSSGLVNLGLHAVAANGAAGATLTLTLSDAKGKAVANGTLTVGASALFQSYYLPAGEYTVTITLNVPKGVTLTGVIYRLSGGLGSDPIGPLATGTRSGPGTTGTSSTSGTSSTTETSSTNTTTTTTQTRDAFVYTTGLGSLTTAYPYSF